MGFRKDAFATVWSVEQGKGNYLNVRLSISRKNKQTDQYEDDFSGFCDFIGAAKAKGEKLKERDRIKLGDTDVTTWYNKEKNTTYTHFKVFDFEMADSAQGTAAKTNDEGKKPPVAVAEEGETDEDDLPF